MSAGSGQPPRTRPQQLQFQVKTQDNPLHQKIRTSVSQFEWIEKGEITELEEIGRGSMGTVHLVRARDGRYMARKTMKLTTATNHEQVHRELDILRQCKHEQITAFFGAYSDCNFLSICMEVMDSSLGDMVQSVGFVPEDDISWIALNVLKGVDYLKKELNVLHRDIKPTNILANRSGQVKLCDMGVSGTLEKSVAKTKTGTKCYMSPERIDAKKYGILAEVWSVGITLVELAMGRYPFPVASERDLLRLKQKISCWQQRRWDELMRLARSGNTFVIDEFELTECIIDGEPPRLPEHLFIGNLCDFVSLCLKKEPEQRSTVASLLGHNFLVSSSTNDGRCQQRQFSQLVERSLQMKSESKAAHVHPSKQRPCLIM